MGSVFHQDMGCCVIILEILKYFCSCILFPLHSEVDGLHTPACFGQCLKHGVYFSLCWWPMGVPGREEDSPEWEEGSFGQCGSVLEQQRFQELIALSLKVDHPQSPPTHPQGPQNCQVCSSEPLYYLEWELRGSAHMMVSFLPARRGRASKAN